MKIENEKVKKAAAEQVSDALMQIRGGLKANCSGLENLMKHQKTLEKLGSPTNEYVLAESLFSLIEDAVGYIEAAVKKVDRAEDDIKALGKVLSERIKQGG